MGQWQPRGWGIPGFCQHECQSCGLWLWQSLPNVARTGEKILRTWQKRSNFTRIDTSKRQNINVPKIKSLSTKILNITCQQKKIFSFRQIQLIKQELLLVVQKSCVFNKKLPNFTLFFFKPRQPIKRPNLKFTKNRRKQSRKQVKESDSKKECIKRLFQSHWI